MKLFTLFIFHKKELQNLGKNVTLYKVPEDIRIKGNVAASKTAKEVTDMPGTA